MTKRVLIGLLAIVVLGGAGAAVFYSLNWSRGGSGEVEGAVIINCDGGKCNWTQMYIEAKGNAVAAGNVSSPAQAKVTAREGAIKDAQRRLLEIIEGVRIDAKTTMVNFMANDLVKAWVHGRIKEYEIVPGSERWANGIYEVKLRVWISDICSAPAVCRSTTTFLPPETPIKKSRYTGLVIDATSISLVPQVLIGIYDETGKLIYGAAKVFYQAVADRGLVKYFGVLEAAKGDPRVGDNPLVVKAIAAGGDFNTDIIVSVEDGQRIINELDGTDVFANAKVIVVID